MTLAILNLTTPTSFTYLWLIVAVLFLLLELLSPGLFFFLSFSVGSCFGALAASLDFSFSYQCLLFVLGSAISLIALRMLFASKKVAPFKTNVSALLGKSAHVLEAVSYHGGYVKVDGEVWPARSQENISKGELVRVVKIVGNSLIVNKEH